MAASDTTESAEIARPPRPASRRKHRRKPAAPPSARALAEAAESQRLAAQYERQWRAAEQRLARLALLFADREMARAEAAQAERLTDLLHPAPARPASRIVQDHLGRFLGREIIPAERA